MAVATDDPLTRTVRVLVCRGPTCGDLRNSIEISTALTKYVEQNRATDPRVASVVIGKQSCFGQCQRGPNLLIREELQAKEGDKARRPMDGLGLAVSALTGLVGSPRNAPGANETKAAFMTAATPTTAVARLERFLNTLFSGSGQPTRRA